MPTSQTMALRIIIIMQFCTNAAAPHLPVGAVAVPLLLCCLVCRSTLEQEMKINTNEGWVDFGFYWSGYRGTLCSAGEKKKPSTWSSNYEIVTHNYQKRLHYYNILWSGNYETRNSSLCVNLRPSHQLSLIPANVVLSYSICPLFSVLGGEKY